MSPMTLLQAKFESTVNAAVLLQKPRPEEVQYDLFAVIEHKGSSISDGHCVVYAINSAGRWHLYDDARVSEVGVFLCQSHYGL